MDRGIISWSYCLSDILNLLLFESTCHLGIEPSSDIMTVQRNINSKNRPWDALFLHFYSKAKYF